MKTITLNVDDSTYQDLESYSRQTGRDIHDLASACLSSSLSTLDFNATKKRMDQDMRNWMQERSFGRDGRSKAVSHFICR